MTWILLSWKNVSSKAKYKASLIVKQSEDVLVVRARKEQLEFEKAQLKLKLNYEQKMEEV